MIDYKYANAIINDVDSIDCKYDINIGDNSPSNFSDYTLDNKLNRCYTSKNISEVPNTKSTIYSKKRHSCYFNSTNNNNNGKKRLTKNNNNNILMNGYFGLASKEKQDCQNTLFTNYHHRKENSEFQNKIFNEVHQEKEKPLPVRTNYSKRNYSQFILS